MRDSLANVPVPKGGRIAIIGDVHEHEEQFNQILEKIKPSPSMFLVSVGDIYDKGFGKEKADSITRSLQHLNRQGFGFAVRGNHELKNIRNGKKHNNLSPELEWFRNQPLALSFSFTNGSKVTVVHGGVTPNHTVDNLGLDVEVAFIRDVDEAGKMIQLKWVAEDGGSKKLVPAKPGGVSWHSLYDGRFGYIAAGHEPQKDGVAKFYNFSCNLDSACYQTGILSCQIFSENGREELFIAKGPAKKPKDGL